MTEDSDKAAGGVAKQVREWIIVVGSLVAILAGVWWAMLWFTGGLKPQTQVDQDGFRTQLSSIQTTQEKNAAASALANDRIIARLDALPKPSDLESHLTRIDQALLAAYDRATAIEVAASKLAGRFESLMSGDADRANKPQLGRAVR
jgi:hypothetical protein